MADLKVLVATPVMRGELYKRAWLSWYAMDWEGQLDYYQMVGGDHDLIPYNNVTKKYNDARQAMLCGGYDALMTIESDTIVPKDALKRLVAADADVAYGVYVWRYGIPFWTAYMRLEQSVGESLSANPDLAKKSWGKVIETEGVGHGCTLIRRHVLEELEFKWTLGEFGCCDWHFSLDCKRLGFTQKHDLGLVCGHIAVDPVYRILWPDANANGLYRSELLENWEPLPKGDKWLTGKEIITVDGGIKVKVLRRFHRGNGVYANPAEVIGVTEEMGKRLVEKGIAEFYKEVKKRGPKVTIDEPEVPEEILEPGWEPKDDDCPDCPAKDKKKKK